MPPQEVPGKSFSSDPEQQRLSAELVKQLYSHALIGLLATVINAFVLVVIQRDASSRAALIVWIALNNIAKDSKADSVSLSLRKSGTAIEFFIRDNGQGFDPAASLSRPGTTRGLGLDSMRERVEFSGGSYFIESSGGAGTAIRAFWPVANSESLPKAGE